MGLVVHAFPSDTEEFRWAGVICGSNIVPEEALAQAVGSKSEFVWYFSVV